MLDDETDNEEDEKVANGDADADDAMGMVTAQEEPDVEDETRRPFQTCSSSEVVIRVIPDQEQVESDEDEVRL